MVETAGGSGGRRDPHAGLAASHQGMVEGLDNAPQIRDLILSRLRRSRSAGLGDDHVPNPPAADLLWSPAHLACLREICDAVHGMVPRGPS